MTGLSCHRHRQNFFRQLDASVGASGPHDFAVRLARHSSRARPRPPHPALYVRDDRETPLCEAGRGELVEMICPTGKAEYFSQKDWTTQITLIRLDKSPVSRNGLRRRGACHRARSRDPLAPRHDGKRSRLMTRARSHKSGLVTAACSMPAMPRERPNSVPQRNDAMCKFRRRLCGCCDSI